VFGKKDSAMSMKLCDLDRGVVGEGIGCDEEVLPTQRRAAEKSALLQAKNSND
jgi:hypothetical protein